MGDSGHFVLARWTDDEKTEIEMTAFKVNVVHMIQLGDCNVFLLKTKRKSH